MPITQSTIPDDYDANGLQKVDDSIFTPEVEETQQESHESEPQTEPQNEPNPEPQDTPQDETPEPQQDETKEEKPKEEPKEERLYAGKFKTEQDLKNSFIELGGDPAKYDSIEKLEEAYLVRQSEFSRARQDIKEERKSIQELIQEEFAKIDPSQFQTPQDMWLAQQEALSRALGKFEEQSKEMISPEQLHTQMKQLEALHELESKVPRLKTDENLQRAFATHIMRLREENRMPIKDGLEDLQAAFADFVKGQQAIVEEAQRIFNENQSAKKTSTAVSTEKSTNSQTTPAPQEDDIVDEILAGYQEMSKKYNT